MGCINPENIAFSDYAKGVDTIEDIMKRRRWSVRARCQHCGLIMKVDLRLIAKIAGPRTSLWDRQVPCKKWGCAGKAVFQAKPHPALKTYTDMISAHRVGYLGARPDRLDGRPVAPLD